MKIPLVIALIPILFLGCSGVTEITGTEVTPSEAASSGSNNWSWGFWTLSFNEDHTKVEVIPQRRVDYHFCVTKFMENWPCKDCLTLGQPVVQPDKTVKLNVTMKHPFPNAPQYTGFDVRGMAYFPPTMVQSTNAFGLSYRCKIYNESGLPYQVLPAPYLTNLPLIFSRANQGGGEVLNADGYSCYLIPGVTYSTVWPVFSYSEPKHNKEPTPFTTINPYRLFASDTDRRMFLVSDVISREYHLALPPGKFCFGYAVDASWWPPTNVPVTNPAVDFPRAANAEDPWNIEFEQILPINEENVGKDIFKVVIHHRGTGTLWGSNIWAWGLSSTNPGGAYPHFGNWIGDIVDDYTTQGYINLTYNWWFTSSEGINPGHHLGVLVVGTSMPFSGGYINEMEHIYGVRFVDIYIEG